MAEVRFGLEISARLNSKIGYLVPALGRLNLPVVFR